MNLAHLKPWHTVMELRPEIRSGDLSLAFFAADLTQAVMGEGPEVYREPAEFFALTYPTANLKKLAREVVLRLARRSDKAVRQLELTYGGGKTHTLLTLYHLVRDPAHLPEQLPAVQEFLHSIGQRPPATSVGFVGFDKLDPVKGIKTRAPDGTLRSFLYPWNVLAWQLAGQQGLEAIGSGEQERTSPPFTNVLQHELFPLVLGQGRALLLLLDEVLMWAVEQVREQASWLEALQNFFQSLSQAVAASPGAALVVSLLASDTRYSEGLGRQVAQRLSDVLRREQEEPVQPVEKKDVAEVLRRRLFTAGTYRDQEAGRPGVSGAVAGIAALDEATERNRGEVEEELLRSYPFDPQLTEVLYSKWTQLSGFQRTRGVLRTFALALREASWDTSPLVGPAVFLGPPEQSDLSESLRELVDVADRDAVEGRRQNWRSILQGELEKAREAQEDYTLLKHREIEQAVVTTFLHSQPAGQKASLTDLYRAVGQTHPDKIQLGRALAAWARSSWFLDEAGSSDLNPAGVPRTWRLGAEPNLKQMHDQFFAGVQGEVGPRLEEALKKVKSIYEVGTGSGIKVHKLPAAPADVGDDNAFHYVVLGPAAASDPDRPSALALRFLDETTEQRTRNNRNLLVLAVPSQSGLAAARDAVASWLSWQKVALELAGQELDPLRAAKLKAEVEGSARLIPERIKQAWCIGVTLDKHGQAAAWQVTPDNRGLFSLFQADRRFRIQDGAVRADALLPGGPYDVWTEGNHSERYLQDIVEAFAQWPQLPKVLRPESVRATLAAAGQEGLLVLRRKRPDGSWRTWWKEELPQAELTERELKVVLPDQAELTRLEPGLLAPGALPGLWSAGQLTFGKLRSYFAGENAVMVPVEGGYEEPLLIPRAAPAVLGEAVREAVASGKVWLTSGEAGYWQEKVPENLDLSQAVLREPPALIGPEDFTPARLPEAWSEGGTTTAAAVLTALSGKAGGPLPWKRVRQDLAAALSAKLLVRTEGEWPCEREQAGQVRFQVYRPATDPREQIGDSGAGGGATVGRTAGGAGGASTEDGISSGGGWVAPVRPRPTPGGRRKMSAAELQLFAEALSRLSSVALEYGTELRFELALQLEGEVETAALVALNQVFEEEGVDFTVSLHG